MRRAWLTPDEFGDLECVQLMLPNSVEQTAIVRGLFLLLADERNWQQYGTKTPADMAEYWLDVISDNIPFGECAAPIGVQMYVGTFFWYLAETPPAGCLVCDGAELDTATYPELFDVIGYTFGGADDVFNLPDLTNGSAPKGALGGYTLGEQGGFTHRTLDVSNLPAHSHDLYNQAPSGASQRVLPLANTAGFVTATSQVGSGAPFDIRNVYTALVPMVVAESV